MRPPTFNLLLLWLCYSLLALINTRESKPATPPRKHLTTFNRHIVDDHKQIYDMSCIPMSVEMVLKLLEKVPGSYYDQQNSWKNKSDGSFANFDGKTIEGVTFHQQFALGRDDNFPMAKLFEAIDKELKAGRFVIVGLASGPQSFHNWVIYDEDANGDFLAVSKSGSETLKANHVKKLIIDMKGTDIGTYEFAPQQKNCSTKFSWQIVDNHKQIYDMSCIPMSIEMVLKLLDRVPGSYYDLQNPWKNKMDGNFSNFDGKTIEGVTFHKQFGLDRNDKFPLKKLFETIDLELKAGRFVIISLASSSGWHMWVIYDEDTDGDFLAVSKSGGETLKASHIKKIITDMKGTDIMTYKLKR